MHQLPTLLLLQITCDYDDGETECVNLMLLQRVVISDTQRELEMNGCKTKRYTIRCDLAPRETFQI